MEDIPVPVMLSQQEETDWGFVRRIANQFGYTVFVDSKSPGKRISIGTVPFSQSGLHMGGLPALSKDIAAFWRIKNNTAPKASAYEFLQQGCQTPVLTAGVGHAVSGGLSPQIIVKSQVSARGGLLANTVTAAYQDGAYPPSGKDAGDANKRAAGNIDGIHLQRAGFDRESNRQWNRDSRVQLLPRRKYQGSKKRKSLYRICL